jgi:hypothetical protein
MTREPFDAAQATRRRSLDSGGALHAYLVQARRNRRKTDRDRRRAERADVGRRIGDIATNIMHRASR